MVYKRVEGQTTLSCENLFEKMEIFIIKNEETEERSLANENELREVEGITIREARSLCTL